MTAFRTPKRPCPARMCFECKNWEPCTLDWGECFWMAEAVPGTEYRLTYAYGECAFLGGAFERKERV